MKSRTTRRRISENQKVTLTLGQLKRLIRESVGGESDEDLARGMAVDIIEAFGFCGCFDPQNTDEDDVHEYFGYCVNTNAKPTENNIEPGDEEEWEIWRYFEPGCRYNIDYPYFDKALKAKTGIDYRKHDEEDFYTLDNCKMIYDALNPIYKRALRIAAGVIIDDPSVLDADEDEIIEKVDAWTEKA